RRSSRSTVVVRGATPAHLRRRSLVEPPSKLRCRRTPLLRPSSFRLDESTGELAARRIRRLLEKDRGGTRGTCFGSRVLEPRRRGVLVARSARGTLSAAC